jgi:Fe-S cluster biosynthesis and repair protein YggX
MIKRLVPHFTPRSGISLLLGVSSKFRCFPGAPMANESCDPIPPPTEPVKPGTRMVHCVKFGREMPGLDRVPWKGELGKRVYESVSKDAWKLWIEHSKMVMNEYRLNPLDPNSQKIMEEQMEQFFFGEGSKLPEGYVAPKAKG